MLETNRQRIERAAKSASSQVEPTMNCAQSTLAGLIDEFLPDYPHREEAMKMASLMQGVANRGETCGAVQGAVMFFGLLYGRDLSQGPKLNPKEFMEYNTSTAIATLFAERFKSEYKSTLCRDIHTDVMGKTYDFLNPKDGMQFFMDGALQKCQVIPEAAARMAAEMILEREEKKAK